MTSKRSGTASALLALLALLVLRCTPARQAPSPPTVSLKMSGTPPEATVIIDDEPVGALDFVAAHGVALPPGMHTVTAKARGYLPMDRVVEAKTGSGPLVIRVALIPVPD
ncbi:MAG: hypothetical protein M3O50_11225 [Myxococcota bacterium]|nr:hypothetical protein [Myxococcota bacterium]